MLKRIFWIVLVSIMMLSVLVACNVNKNDGDLEKDIIEFLKSYFYDAAVLNGVKVV